MEQAVISETSNKLVRFLKWLLIGIVVLALLYWRDRRAVAP